MGADYYGILRRSVGVPAALVEVAYISNAAEARLIATEDFREQTASAIVRSITRFFTTTDAGGGFREPLDPLPPTGQPPSGGFNGCTEPSYEEG